YTEPVSIDKSVELRGRCASKVTIDGSDADPMFPKVLYVTGGTVTVRGVRLSGEGVGVYAEGSTANVTVDHSVVDGALGTGVAVDRAGVTITNSLIQHVRKFSEYTEVNGGGIYAETRGQVTVTGSALFETPAFGVALRDDGARLSLTNTLVEGSRYRAIDLEG